MSPRRQAERALSLEHRRQVHCEPSANRHYAKVLATVWPRSARRPQKLRGADAWYYILAWEIRAPVDTG